MMASLLDHQPESEALENRPMAEETAQDAPTDSQLLKQFVHDRRQQAFTELVARHAAMVLGVCKRVLRDDHEAEDVFQATFLILATKGRQVQRRHPASLAAWLHRVAYRAALRTAQAKHRKGKPLVDEVQAAESEQWLTIAQQEEQLVLHEELNKLPRLYREALVLCCLEGNSCKEAAGQLDSTPEAVQKRVDRGKQMLRLRLARRGVAASIALLAIGATTAEAAALPSLVSLTSEICTATVLNADSSIYSTNVGHIAQQGATSMKLFTPAAIAASLLVVSAPLLLYAGLAGTSGDYNSATNLNIDAAVEELPDAEHTIFVADEAASGKNLSERVKIILDRQKGDTLRLYVNRSRSYINGRQLSAGDLETVVEELGTDKAIISAEPDVPQQRRDFMEEKLREAGVDDITFTQPQPKPTQQDTVTKILNRQKGEQLRVYLEGTTGIYVNGTQVSTETLAEVIKQSKLEAATLSAALEVLPQRVAEVEAWLEENGIDDVEKVGTAAQDLTLEEVAELSRERVARAREENLRRILSVQKGDKLKFYIGDNGVYINGRSVSSSDFPAILAATSLDEAVISAEWYLDEEKVAKLEASLREAGVKKVEIITLPKD